MQRAERFFERGIAPVAVVVLLGILAAGAIALDSANIAASPQAQLAQTGSLLPTPLPPLPNPAPAQQTTQREQCVNDTYITITIKTADGSQPVIKKECRLNSGALTAQACPAPQGGVDKKGCYARFCADREPDSNGQTRPPVCTAMRYFNGDEELKSAQSDRGAATTMFAQGIVSDLQLSGTGSENKDILTGLPQNTSNEIISAFRQDAASQLNEIQTAQASYDNIFRQMQTCAETNTNNVQGACGTLLVQEAAAADRLTAEQDRLRQLQEQAQWLGASQGQLSAPLNPSGGLNCLDARDCGSNVTPPTPRPLNGPATFDRDRNQQPPPREQCPVWNIFGCNTGGNIFGGGGQQQCGYYNGQYICVQSQQQCSAIQQALSGCRNPFTGQQQCGGIMLMLNKCPAGSYNPNNPNNPYNYPQPTCEIRTTPNSSGQATTLQWQSQNASYAYLSNSGQVGPSGSMTVYPQGPTTYVMTVVGYGNQQGRCETRVGDQNGSGAVKAELSCQPQIADVGMQVAISFACQNANASGGTGFSTGGALSGTATTTITAPSLGTNTVTYGLLCSSQGVSNNAQCTVNVNKAAIVLVANPKTIESGNEANIGWITSGMDSCVISSTNEAFTSANASSTNVSGSAKTPALTRTESFVLTCESKTGATKAASTTVTVTD
jgi:hypothetical protein